MINHQTPEESNGYFLATGCIFSHVERQDDHPEPVSNRLTFGLFAAGCVVLGVLVYLAFRFLA